MRIILIILAVIYVLSPYDLLSDFMPGLGWTDDMIIMALIWRYVLNRPFPFFGKKPTTHNNTSGGFSRGPDEQRRHTDARQKPRTPREVLGVGENAGPKEITAAYRRLAQKYHPDKVAHLGEEFKVLAEEKFKEIQNAHRELMG